MLKDNFHGVLSSTGLTPTLSSRLLTLASLKVPTLKATSGRRRIKVSSYRWNGFPQKLWLKAFSQRSPMWWVHYRVPSLLTLSPTPWTVYILIHPLSLLLLPLVHLLQFWVNQFNHNVSVCVSVLLTPVIDISVFMSYVCLFSSIVELLRRHDLLHVCMFL